VGVAGRAAIAGPENRDFGRACVAAFVREAHDTLRSTDALADGALDDGLMHLWLDAAGQPVAVALRRPLLAGSARIGPVYTPPTHRGNGYGSGVTAAATRSILDEHGIPVLFTDLANPTSNKIYRAMGYRPVEDRVVIARR
jgi:GNAT superfamily N-acetyltransferase